MSKTLPARVPAPAMLLLNFIGGIEAPRGYNTIFGNNQGKLAKPLTMMTFGDVVEAQPSWTKRFKSSAAGRYQFMRATLIGIAKEVPAIRGDMIFDDDLQDRLGYFLLLRRGYQEFVDGRIGIVEFGKRLAQEWASFPVLAPCEGAHQQLTRGQSYYAGDALNKSLVKPEDVERKLREVLAAANMPPANIPVPVPRPEPVAPPLDRVKPPVDIDPENLDKPIGKSKTVWMWITTALGAPVAAFGGLDWRVQIAILVVIVAFAVYAIKRRHDLAKVVRGIKAEIADA